MNAKRRKRSQLIGPPERLDARVTPAVMFPGLMHMPAIPALGVSRPHPGHFPVIPPLGVSFPTAQSTSNSLFAGFPRFHGAIILPFTFTNSALRPFLPGFGPRMFASSLIPFLPFQPTNFVNSTVVTTMAVSNMGLSVLSSTTATPVFTIGPMLGTQASMPIGTVMG